MYKTILSLLAGMLCFLPCVWLMVGCSAEPSAFERVVEYNLTNDMLYSQAKTDSLLRTEQDATTAARVGSWARGYLADGDSIGYLFGPAEGGYVAEGQLINDQNFDCVSFVYRCSELAQARNTTDAIKIALETRFATADLDSLVDAQGRVNYDRPAHLDYSLDMIRSGHWGANITSDLTGAVADSAGSSRYVARSFMVVPAETLVPTELTDGDIAWLVLNPAHDSGSKLRNKYGLVIGHLGIISVKNGQPWLVHAASSGLNGWYKEGGIVEVPLTEYLLRVDKFYAVIITRYTG